MKYWIFKLKNESLNDLFESEFNSVVYKTKRDAKEAAELFSSWSLDNYPKEQVQYDLYEMNIVKVKK